MTDTISQLRLSTRSTSAEERKAILDSCAPQDMTVRQRGSQTGRLYKWYVKDLSKLTGVSVQTLHHYDRIGLLKPKFPSFMGTATPTHVA